MSFIITGVGFFFVLLVFVLLIVIVIKLVKRKPDSADQSIVQNIAAESAQLQNESTKRQQHLAEELKEVKNRLASIEKILKEVE